MGEPGASPGRLICVNAAGRPRSFMLPDGVDRDKIAADFAKGVRIINMPKTARAKESSKKIEVKAVG
jgi:HSP20 family molecular chaperone IbpA